MNADLDRGAGAEAAGPPGARPNAAASLRGLPSVDAVLHLSEVQALLAGVGRAMAVHFVRQAVEAVRRRVAPQAAAGHLVAQEALHDAVLAELRRQVAHHRAARLQPVINATGVLLHTNLGRAPLPHAAVEAVTAVAQGYSNLEYDLVAGARGHREARLEALLALLCGAEAAFVVNNNAAAVLLLLAATCQGREVLVSRGELIEIGGSFRLPDVMAQSGCRLREVGTTNRTRAGDFAAAIGPETAAILKAHPSNYRIVGFTEAVSRAELASLAHRQGIYCFEDLGSGALVPTERFGMEHEPTVQECLHAGVDAVTFSGDKLLGGPQAGIVAGKRSVVDAVRRHPLARAVRVGKLTLAALTAVLELYAGGAVEELPVWRAAGTPVPQLEARARRLAGLVEKGLAGMAAPGFRVETTSSTATMGGGSLPGETLASVAVCLEPAGSAGGPTLLEELAAALRQGSPPVVGRVAQGRLWLDLRAVMPEQDDALATAVLAALSTLGGGAR